MEDQTRPAAVPSGSELEKRLNALYRVALDIRGHFLDQSIWIDTTLADILALYFCNDPRRRSLLYSEVLTGPDATFSGRIRVLGKILTADFAGFLKEHPKLLDALDKIRRFRNRIAHSPLDTSEEFVAKGHEDRIQLTLHEDGQTKKQIVTLNELGDRLSECTSVLMDLMALQQLVTKKSAV